MGDRKFGKTVIHPPHLNIPVLAVNDDKELFIPAAPTVPVAHPTTTDYPPTSKVSEFGPTKYFQHTQDSAGIASSSEEGPHIIPDDDSSTVCNTVV